MKSIFGITIVLLFGAFCLLQSGTKVGDLITNTEAKNVWAGCAKTGGEVNVCYGGNCSSGGCGCIPASAIMDDPTGQKPMAAEPCGTSACTSPQGLDSGSCGSSNGGGSGG